MSIAPRFTCNDEGWRHPLVSTTVKHEVQNAEGKPNWLYLPEYQSLHYCHREAFSGTENRIPSSFFSVDTGCLLRPSSVQGLQDMQQRNETQSALEADSMRKPWKISLYIKPALSWGIQALMDIVEIYLLLFFLSLTFIKYQQIKSQKQRLISVALYRFPIGILDFKIYYYCFMQIIYTWQSEMPMANDGSSFWHS